MGLLDVFRSKSSQQIDEMSEKKDELELSSWVRQKLEERRSMATRISHEGIWMNNCAAVVGFNGLRFSSATRTLQPINRPGSAFPSKQIQVNKIISTLQNRLARLCKSPPKYDVIPNDNTQDAKDNARFKLDVLNSKWNDLKLNLKRIALYMWLQECGHAYLYTFWNDAKGELLRGEDGEWIFEGDVDVEVVSAFEVFPDPQARSLDECNDLIRAKVRDLQYFKDQYPENGAQVKAEETWLMSLQWESRISTMNARGTATGYQTQAGNNSAIEITYFQKPSTKHPEGRMIVVANGIKLADKPLPIGKISFSKFDDIPVGGKYYPEAVVTHLRPVSEQYNQGERRIADWINKTVAGKFLSPRGNQLIQESPSEISGEIWQYDPVPSAPNGGEPRALDIPTIPQWVFTQQDRYDSMFGEISGINEPSKGQMPSAQIPAIGMQLLVEQDETRIGVMTEQHEYAWAITGGHILDFIQKYYVTARKMKYLGKNEYVVSEVLGEKLQGNNDVIVVRGSTIPGSKVLKRQEIINAWQSGLLGDPADPKVRQNVLTQIEYGDVAEIYIDSALDAKMLKSITEQIEAGDMPDIHEMDNHVYFIQELNRYRKSEKFSLLSDVSKQILEAVIEECLRFLMIMSGAKQEPVSPEMQAQAQAKTQETMAQEIGQNAELMPEVAPAGAQLSGELAERKQEIAPEGLI